MADFVLRKRDGWLEITSLIDQMDSAGYITWADIWNLIADGTTSRITQSLDLEHIHESPDDETIEIYESLGSPKTFVDYFLMITPGAMGERHRIWGRLPESPKDWKP